MSDRRSASAFVKTLYLMKFLSVFFAYPLAAALALSLVGGGCTHDYAFNQPTPRRTIPLAPTGAVGTGIGGPGGTSSDTRATGTIASGEGDSPIGVTDPASAPVVAPGVAPGSGTAGVHSGSRY